MTSLLLLCTMVHAAPLDTLIGAEEVTDSFLFGPPSSDVRAENHSETSANTPETKTFLKWDDLAASAQDDQQVDTRTSAASISAIDPMILMPLGLGLLAAAWFLRRKVMARVSGIERHETLTIISNKALGNHGNIVVVDVLDLDGTPRRLVVGAGQGSPTLVADISAPNMFFAEPDTLEDSPVEHQEYVTEAPVSNTPATAPISTCTDIKPIQKRAAQDLVDELLAERQGYGRTLRGSRLNITA